MHQVVVDAVFPVGSVGMNIRDGRYSYFTRLITPKARRRYWYHRPELAKSDIAVYNTYVKKQEK